MIATIKGVYTHKKSGEQYLTKDGNPYNVILFTFDDQSSIYENFWSSVKAHFRYEDLFAATGRVAPAAGQVTIADLNAIIGEEIEVNVGKNKAGYDTIKKFYPKANVAQTVAVDEQVPDEIAEQSADLDLDEDVPF